MRNSVALPVNSNPGWVLGNWRRRKREEDEEKEEEEEVNDEAERCHYLARFAVEMFAYKQRIEK